MKSEQKAYRDRSRPKMRLTIQKKGTRIRLRVLMLIMV